MDLAVAAFPADAGWDADSAAAEEEEWDLEIPGGKQLCQDLTAQDHGVPVR